MRIVLDANVLVSALISAKGTPAMLLVYWQEGTFDVVASPAMLQELEHVLHILTPTEFVTLQKLGWAPSEA